VSRAISIATFNTHGSLPFSSRHPVKQYQAIGEAFEHLPLDVIHLQEVWSYDLLSILRKKLSSYPYVAYTHGMFGPQAGLATFSRTPLTIARFTNFPPVGEPRKRKLWNRLKRAMKKKGMLVCQVVGQNLLFCNAHLVANGDGDWSPTNRYYCAHEHDIEQLVSLIGDLTCREGANTLVISGDFNIPKCSDLYQKFVDLSLVVDVFAGDDSPTFHEEALPPGAKVHCIDYLFVRPQNEGISVRKTAYLFQDKILVEEKEQYVSDHMGLMAEVTFLPQ
jgi:sphingomyelin phosphodiesterase 2